MEETLGYSKCEFVHQCVDSPLLLFYARDNSYNPGPNPAMVRTVPCQKFMVLRAYSGEIVSWVDI